MQSAKEQYLLFRIRMFKDEQAFASLYEQHVDAVRRFLRLKLPSIEDADDATANTFLRVWNYLTSQRVESVSGLIYTIARGVAAEFYRTRKIETIPIEHDQFASSDDTCTEAELTIVRQHIDKLAPDDQQVIYLRHFEGKSMREIGKLINKSENAASMMVYRAMERLREYLDPRP